MAINTARLPTVLLPGNESARTVILSAFTFEPPTHEFRINPRSLREHAREQMCSDPLLFRKAERIIFELNKAKFPPKEEAPKKEGGDATIN